MSLTEKDVTKIARLARIGMTDAEKNLITADLLKILELVKQLESVDTEEAAQMINVNNDAMPVRKDTVTDGNYVEDIVRNSALVEHNCFAVPKVVE